MENQAKIATENEAAFKQIKLIQELYELCLAIMEIWKHKELLRPKMIPLYEICKNPNNISNNCSKKSPKKKLQLSENFPTCSHKRGLICKPFSHLTNNSSFRSITISLCSLF